MKKSLYALCLALILAAIIVAVVAPVVVARYISRPVVIEKSRLLMGTIVEIKVPLTGHLDRGRVTQAMDQALDEVERLEHIFSIYRPDSEVSAVNRLMPGASRTVSPELLMVVEKAIDYKTRTNGVFDISIKPLKDLWQDAGMRGSLPTQSALDAAREKVDARAIALDRSAGSISFRKPGMAIDLGGIVKGYAADRAALILKQHGIAHAIVSVGSGMYCLGGKSEGHPWMIAIRNPRDKTANIYELSITDKGIDTSGDYERFFLLGGKRYSHIIDPRSGLPIGDAIVSATVLAADSMIADIYATTLCILGEEGLRLAEAAGVDALIIALKDGHLTVRMTKDFEARYAVTKEERAAP